MADEEDTEPGAVHRISGCLRLLQSNPFDGKLKPGLLNFRGRHKRNMGLFWPKKWARADGGVTHEIALNSEVLLRPLMETFGTLVHEMCHQWQEDFGKPPRGGYHDRQWGSKWSLSG